MRVVLTGMFNRQLAEIANELRAEFPEVVVDVIGNDEGARRICSAARSAALVVSGRFMAHKVVRSLQSDNVNLRFVNSGGARGIASAVREWLR